MTPISDLFPYATMALAAVAATLSLLPACGNRGALKTFATLALTLASITLVLELAHPALVPPSSIVIRPDGSSDDPRVLAALVLGLAALAAYAPAIRSLKLPVFGLVGSLLPGMLLGGALAALLYFVGLHAPLALAGTALAGLVIGVGLSLLLRLMKTAGLATSTLPALGVAVLVGTAVVSLHGGRASELQLMEGHAVDTLGYHLMLSGAEAVTPTLQRMHVVVGTGKDSTRLSPSLGGSLTQEMVSSADAGLFSGPVLVPLALHSMGAPANESHWLKKQETFEANGASVRFVKFRIEMQDSVRMYADLEITKGGKVETISPGVTAHATGEIPFSVQSTLIGPVAVSGIDADNGRVAIMMDEPPAAPMHVALMDVRLRPALPLAWAATALVLIGFLIGLAIPVREGRRA